MKYDPATGKIPAGTTELTQGRFVICVMCICEFLINVFASAAQGSAFGIFAMKFVSILCPFLSNLALPRFLV
jgi:hypothetical protein